MAIKLSNDDYPIGRDTEIGEFRTELDADYAVAADADVEDEGPSTSSSSIAMSSSDPATWKNLSNMQRESIVISGPPANPSSFPRDSYGRCFPKVYFTKHCKMEKRLL